MSGTSYQVCERVRKAISTEYVTASDSEISKALKISRAAISAYKNGRDIMGADVLQRASELADFDPEEKLNFSLLLASDASEKSPEARALWDSNLRVHKYLIERARTFGTIKNGAASILLGALAMAAHVQPAKASVMTSPAGSDASNFVYYVKRARGRFRDRFRALRQQVAGALTLPPLAHAA